MKQNKAQADPIQFILKSQIGSALSKGFTVLYKNKPQFPITYLGKWLKQYSNTQKIKQNLINSKNEKEQRYKIMQQLKQKSKEQQTKRQDQLNHQKSQIQKQFQNRIEKAQYMEDLLCQWLPQYLQINQKLSGSYVGKMRHPRKKLQQHIFDPATQYDTQAPKIIQYIGSSKNHKQIMIGKILPAENGKSFDVFNIPEDQPPEQPVQGQQGQKKEQKPPKKKYIYVPDILKQQKIYYFKFPRLGSFACYPIKYKTYLLQGSFDKGIVDYKQHLRAKQQIKKEYDQKLNQLRNQMQEARKKYEQFQVSEQQASIAERDTLKQAFDKAQQAFTNQQNNPPNPPQLIFDSIQQCYVVGCDTMGQDRTLSNESLDNIDSKIICFKNQWQKKQKNMLMNDILAFIEDQNTLEAQLNHYNENQKSIVSNIQSNVKQHFPNSQKQQQFQISASKCQKLIPLLSDQMLAKSRTTFFKYYVPKFKEIIQIGMMLVGYNKQQINNIQSNTLNWRKIKQQKFIDEFIQRLASYQLKRQESGDSKTPQYKINKLLQRCQKIDMQALGRYNIWLYALATIIKSMCWARIQCRDAKAYNHQKKIKAKQQRQVQIAKWEQQIQSVLKTQISELQQQQKESFNEQDWRKNYLAENPKPQPLQVEQLKPHLDIE